MWAAMLTWITGAKWRLAAGAVIAIALFAAIQWYGNRQWAQGVETGRNQAAAEIEKIKRGEWAEREREIAAKEAQASQILGRVPDLLICIRQAALLPGFQRAVNKFRT